MNIKAVKILVVDDEPSIVKLLRVSLEAHGYAVQTATTGQEALQIAASTKPEVIILDLGLPDLHGLQVIERLREWSKTPIIVLTVQDSEEDKVQALDAGADDYLTKPFGVPELLARLRVALRHANPEVETPIFENGPLEIDRAGHVVKVAGKVIKLTATEYDILNVLARHAGKVVTHRVLLREVWGPNAVEHTQYLRVYLGQVRRKLAVDEQTPEFIVTESGVGYRLVMLG